MSVAEVIWRKLAWVEFEYIYIYICKYMYIYAYICYIYYIYYVCIYIKYILYVFNIILLLI